MAVRVPISHVEGLQVLGDELAMRRGESWPTAGCDQPHHAIQARNEIQTTTKAPEIISSTGCLRGGGISSGDIAGANSFGLPDGDLR